MAVPGCGLALVRSNDALGRNSSVIRSVAGFERVIGVAGVVGRTDVRLSLRSPFTSHSFASARKVLQSTLARARIDHIAILVVSVCWNE